MQRVYQGLQSFCVDCVPCWRQMDSVLREQFFLEVSIRTREVTRQIQHAHCRIAFQLQCIKSSVCLPDVFVEGNSGCMAGKNLRNDDGGRRESAS